MGEGGAPRQRRAGEGVSFLSRRGQKPTAPHPDPLPMGEGVIAETWFDSGPAFRRRNREPRLRFRGTRPSAKPSARRTRPPCSLRGARLKEQHPDFLDAAPLVAVRILRSNKQLLFICSDCAHSELRTRYSVFLRPEIE